MENNSNITSTILEAINTILGNLFSSIDNNIYTVLDDITFVSSHRLKNPIFTNEEVKNFIIYNDNAFSCEVYLEKNMIVSGKDKVDIMHDRLYFIYYEDGYKLVNMESI